MATIYPEQPDIRPIKFTNGNTYKLITPYIYEDQANYIYVPANFEYDGASIPRWAWTISGLSPDGLHRAAALCHDWLYITKGRQRDKTYTRKEVDILFKKIMILSGCSKFKANIAYLAVRAGGWTYWN